MNTTHDDSLAARYAAVRARTVSLLDGLDPEDCNLQPEPDVSPAKWHVAHTTWFFETFVLQPFAPAHEPASEGWAYCFNSYYEACGARQPRAHRADLSRPLLREVLAWRRRVDAAMGALLASLATEPDAARTAAIHARTRLGLAHEEQHQELLVMDVLAAFAAQPLRPTWRQDPVPVPSRVAEDRWIPLEGGLVEVGHDGDGFCFDNETPRHTVFVAPFALGARLVTNAAWQAFVEDGGYRTASWWLSDGWAWVQAHGIQHPRYWIPDGEGGFGQFTVRGVGALEAEAPVVHVSGYEAEAFAAWSGARLPTEHELELALRSAPSEGHGACLEDGAWTPRPATPGPGVRQALGDAWTWTRSAYLPYPGFAPLPGALGEYNGKFMSGQWVLRGSSCLTPREHARVTYRNFFHPHQRWMVSGVRLARDVSATPSPEV